ncbi:MAG: hypothetical protein IAG13_10190 [Deltaproteobacteria bacterium]|nr:hypothetical protein [Nannocystaceae bacterium]
MTKTIGARASAAIELEEGTDELAALREDVPGRRALACAVTLSGGEAQRIELARGLARSSTGRTLFYCDSLGHQIEHLRPKTAYPASGVRAAQPTAGCGYCSNAKGNRFAVLVASESVELACSLPLSSPPPDGGAMVINPRFEDPLHHLELDLAAMFYFRALEASDTVSARRAGYTIELLGLNARGFSMSSSGPD